jgi:ATP-dependent Zn protease
MTRKPKPLNDPRHTATHEAGHAVIGRVLTLLCEGATIRPDYAAGAAGHAVTEDPLACESEWYRRCKFRSNGAVYRARIITYMAGAEAEVALLGATNGGDGSDRHQINLMVECLDRCDLDMLRRMTRTLVCRHRRRIDRVATALLKRKTLTRKQIDKLAGRSVADLPDLHRVHLQDPSGEVITVNVERRVKARGRSGFRQRTERELTAVAVRKARSIVQTRRPSA